MPILQDTKEHTCKQWKQAMHLLSALQSNTMTFVLEPFYKLSFPTSSFHSGLTTTCNLMWSDDAQFQKPHCCCYIQNNHLTSIWQYETRPTKIMHPKHKKEIQIMIPISTLSSNKNVFPLCLAQPHSCHKWLFFPFLIWSVVKCFFFFQSFVWMKFTA